MVRKNNKFKFDVNTFPFIPLSVFMVVVVIFWKKLVSIFKSDSYVATVDAPISAKNTKYLNNKTITAQGQFITGTGQVTKHTVGQAKQNAEELASIMKTGLKDGWFNFALYFSFSGSLDRLKKILNPNYPASYRRYVIESYYDIFTAKRSLQNDVKSHLTGFAGTTFWTNDITKYFTT